MGVPLGAVARRHSPVLVRGGDAATTSASGPFRQGGGEPRDPLRATSSRFAETEAALVGRCAARALLAELATYPKPGLVSLVDTGSHDDMDAATFRASVAALEPFFTRLASAGATGVPLSALRTIGLEAEAAMLAATGGINTHRGAIFALGLLCAAAGARANGSDGCDLAGSVRDTWGEALAAEVPASGSHGAHAMRCYGVVGARGEAAAGFPAAVRVGLLALREGRRLASASPWQNSVPHSFVGSGQGRWGREPSSTDPHDHRAAWSDASPRPTPAPDFSPRGRGRQIEHAARVHAFFALLASLEDTNLLHRGGAEGLAFARASAAAFLAGGGVGVPGWYQRAVAVHRTFVARRLSPGGSADLLAVTLFLDARDAW